MIQVETLFSLLDSWRHLPNYQLERRADIFFALYLKEVLEKKYGISLKAQLIPEFPVRIGTIYQEVPIDKSYKIDYVALSDSGKKAFFVELKTERLSRRVNQDKYLKAAKKTNFTNLLIGILDIFRATQSKRKYYHLLLLLERLELLDIPTDFKRIMKRENLQGINDASREINITSIVKETEIIYVQPNGDGIDIIPFSEFAYIVENYDDMLSQRFAKSLREWAALKAGEK